MARLKRVGGVDIAGCDGAHSAVRQALAIGFPGGTYEHLFYVADVAARGCGDERRTPCCAGHERFSCRLSVERRRTGTPLGTVRADAEHPRENLSWDDVSTRVIAWMHIEVERVHWFSTYHVHHRVADRFAKGRAFLLGEAAHIHSPVGGQSMNTGIGDAASLAWKLAAVLQGRANASLLELRA